MSNSFEENSGDAGDMDDIGRLIHYAGARDTLSSERIEKSRQGVATHWEQVVAQLVWLLRRCIWLLVFKA